MSLKVPLLDLQAQYRPLRDEILAAITRVSDSQRFVMGPEIAALEGELARMVDVGHAVAVSSGTDALLLALMTLGVRAGDEVVTSAYSFFATAGVIARVRALRQLRGLLNPLMHEMRRVSAASVAASRTRS